MIYVSDHVAVQFANRVMGMKQIKKPQHLSFIQMKQLKCKVLNVLDKYVKQIHELHDGWFVVDGFTYVIEAFVVITVFDSAAGPSSEFKGGITQSGKKLKKLIKTSKYKRRRNVKSTES